MKCIAVRVPMLATVLILLGGALETAPAGEHAFVGSQKCKICHLREWKSWSETKMARALGVLRPGERADAKKAAGLDPSKDYTTDPKCVRCHVTGYGEQGGFTSVEATPGLAGVGCEMCHGAGGTYTRPEYMSLKNKNYKKASLVAAGLADTVSEQQCKVCHNGESPFVGENYVFDFEVRKTQGTHEKFPLKYEH